MFTLSNCVNKQSMKQYYAAIQLNLVVSDMRCLKFCAILNFFPAPFSMYHLPPCKKSRYLEVPYIELFAISN